jgi:hypothetical protein
VLVLEVAAGVVSAGEDPAVLLGAIDSMNTPAVDVAVENFLNSADPSLKAVELAGSLARQKPGVTQHLVRWWPTIASSRHRQDVLAALAHSWRDPAPEGVRHLASLAQGAAVGSELRAAAIKALAAIHTTDALPLLATLLASEDPAERLQGL